MRLALRPETELAVEPLAHRVRALREARDRYQLQITAQRAVLELAQAQGDEKEAEGALVEITLALHARAVAQRHLERLGTGPPRQPGSLHQVDHLVSSQQPTSSPVHLSP